MWRHVLPAVVLAALLVLSGCAGDPGASAPDADLTPTAATSTTPTGTPAPGTTGTSTATPTVTPAATPTATPTPTPAPVESLPSPSDCLTDATPQPDAVDGVAPSAYPKPPANVTRDGVVGWVQAFETAYFRNVLLAEEPADDEYNLTEISTYAEVRRVDHTRRGYVVRISDSGATNYASGMHGDRWVDVGYVVNETHVVRVPLDGGGGPVRASDGTVVVDCS